RRERQRRLRMKTRRLAPEIARGYLSRVGQRQRRLYRRGRRLRLARDQNLYVPDIRRRTLRAFRRDATRESHLSLFAQDIRARRAFAFARVGRSARRSRRRTIVRARRFV